MLIARSLALPAAALLLAAAATARAEVFAFSSLPMTGSQEVPAVPSDGYGTITALYDNTTRTLTFSTLWQLQAGATASAAHFHGPADLTQSAPILIPVETPAANTGRQSGSVVLTAEQEAMLLAGNIYYNVHSDRLPAGELRGQLIENSQQVTAPVLTLATGALNLPWVIVPGVGVYSAQMQLTSQSVPFAFSVTGASELR